MTEFSKRFNFDDFDEQCREAIESAEHTELDAKLCLEGIERELRPGEIGAVIATPLFKEWFGDDDLPPAA